MVERNVNLAPDGTPTNLLGLDASGNLVKRALTTNELDNTGGRILKAGDFGLGRASWGIVITDMNLFSNPTGFYYLNGPATANKPSFVSYGVCYVNRMSVDAASQIVAWSGGQAIRYGTGGVWGAWALLYGQNNILGTVAQSAGVPTGALIERGSNANGEYVRFADGAQICTREVSIDALAVTLARGAVYESAGAAYSFPAAFTGEPHFTSATLLGSDNTLLRNGTISALCERGGSSSWPSWNAVRAVCGFSAACAVGELTTFKLFAIGRWF